MTMKLILCALMIFNRAVAVTGLFSVEATQASRVVNHPYSLKKHSRRQQQQRFFKTHKSSYFDHVNSQNEVLFDLRGGGVDEGELVQGAFDWCANLGAPAALVAGGVLATLIDARDEMAPRKNDSHAVRTSKQACRFLLLTSFGLEVISIFVTTVTGTMLMTHGDRAAGHQNDVKSPMGYLHHNLEFEYLTSRITFLQGLFNWLASVALHNLIPREGEGRAARQMNLFIASSLTTVTIAMLAFYNGHMTFYKNYAHMLWTYAVVVFQRYVWNWPIRPLTFVLVPSALLSFYLGYSAFVTPPEDD